MPDFLEALNQEIGLRRTELEEKVDTIYFGGGTPSSLDIKSLKLILDSVRNSFELSDDFELTFEMNPEHIDQEYIEGLRKIGVNRISLGIQSFDDDELKLLGRQHDRKRALEGLALIRKVGFDNISFDLIMGIPAQSLSKWQQNLDQALAFRPEHLSIYMLSIEEGTPFEHAVKSGKMKAPSADLQAELYRHTYQILCKNGYDPYEISNYSLPGFRSKHNSAYWKQSSYLGLGPSAHSYLENTRSFNPPDLKDYLSKLKEGILPGRIETRNSANVFNEFILSSLRRSEGIDLEEFKDAFGKQELNDLLVKAKTFIASNELLQEEGRLFLSLEGRLIADQISMNLFLDDDS